MLTVTQLIGFGVRNRSLILIDRTVGTNIGDMTAGGGLTEAFNGTTSTALVNCCFKTNTTSSYVGKTLASSKVFGQAIIYGSNNDGFKGIANPSVTINIRGKQGAAPSSATDGTIIGTTTFTDTTNESSGRTIASTDLSTQWDHIFAQMISTGSGGHAVAELVLYEWF